MERKKMTVRINKIVYERLKLLEKQKHMKFQDIVDEVLELGILELLRGDSNAK